MYASFFRLRREPFSIAPDPHFLFMSEAHREALAHLLYGLDGGGGFVLLTGEIGAGKTTVCRCFLDQVPANCDVAYIFNPKLGATELLRTVCDEFRIELGAGAQTVKDFVDALNDFLLRSHAAGRHSVLVIDEAQALSAEVLEQLRLLTNLETAERKLLQIVLIGQPELRDMLARPELEQLAQRVIARYHLPALSAPESAQYIRHRLAVAGLEGEMPFDARALARIHRLCAGIPRRINLLAGRALLGGYALGRQRIDRRIVEKAAREVFDSPARGPNQRHVAAAALLLFGVAGASALAWVAWPRAQPHPAATAAASAARAASAAPRAAASPASATASAPAPMATPIDGAALLERAPRSAAAGWRGLAALWALELPAGDPCEAAARLQLRCWRTSGGLARIRELDRPVLLTLRDAAQKPSYAVLSGLGPERATIALGDARVTLPLAELAQVWHGEFATLWRPPEGFVDAHGDAPALIDWLARRLPGDTAVQTRVAAFQLAHGLEPDGLPGPLTLMEINRASGVDEPRLGR